MRRAVLAVAQGADLILSPLRPSSCWSCLSLHVLMVCAIVSRLTWIAAVRPVLNALLVRSVSLEPIVYLLSVRVGSVKLLPSLLLFSQRLYRLQRQRVLIV